MLPARQLGLCLALSVLGWTSLTLSPLSAFSSMEGGEGGPAITKVEQDRAPALPWQLELDYLPEAPLVGVELGEMVAGGPLLPRGDALDPDEVRGEVREILKWGDFDLESELVPSWLGMIFRRLRQLIGERLSGKGGAGTALSRAERVLNSNLFRIGLAVALALVLVFLLLRSGILGRLFSPPRAELAYQGVEGAELIGRAELLARQGNFREAVRLGFLALLEVLAIPYYNYLPNRELVSFAERQFPGLGRRLAQLAGLFDQVVYAGRLVEGRAVGEFLDQCRQLMEEVSQRREREEEEEQ